MRLFLCVTIQRQQPFFPNSRRLKYEWMVFHFFNFKTRNSNVVLRDFAQKLLVLLKNRLAKHGLLVKPVVNAVLLTLATISFSLVFRAGWCGPCTAVDCIDFLWRASSSSILCFRYVLSAKHTRARETQPFCCLQVGNRAVSVKRWSFSLAPALPVPRGTRRAPGCRLCAPPSCQSST